LTDRIRPVLAVYVFGVLGLFLAWVPWTEIWDEGTRFLLPTGAALWARSGFTRGVVSGIGLLDLVVAAAEAAAFWRAVRREGKGGLG
jgi:hypothetical protein